MTDTPQPVVQCDIIDLLNSLTEEEKAASWERMKQWNFGQSNFNPMGPTITELKFDK